MPTLLLSVYVTAEQHITNQVCPCSVSVQARMKSQVLMNGFDKFLQNKKVKIEEGLEQRVYTYVRFISRQLY